MSAQHTAALVASSPYTDTGRAGGVDWVAIATFALAVVTVCAILAPIVQGNMERHRRKISGLSQLRQVIGFFQQRVRTVLNDLNRSAAVFKEGMETMLARALGEDIGQLFPDMDTAMPIYLAMFEAYNAMLYKITVQANPALSQPHLQHAELSLIEAGNRVVRQITELQHKHWFKVWLGL